MEPQPSQLPATQIESSDDTAIADALAAASAEQWKDLWIAVGAGIAEESHATWAGGEVVDTTIVDGVERPVIQMPYPVYSQPMERQLELISALELVVPFDWMSWEGSTATVPANGWRTHRSPTLPG